MGKEFKCPICGCSEHFEIGATGKDDFNLITYKNELKGEVWGELIINGNFNVYLCKKCGHVDLFNTEMVEEINKQNKVVDEKAESIINEINRINGKIKSIKEKTEPVLKRIDELKQLLKSEDITIRQQKSYQQELDQLEEKKSTSKPFKELNILKGELKRQEFLLKELDKYKL